MLAPLFGVIAIVLLDAMPRSILEQALDSLVALDSVRRCGIRIAVDDFGIGQPTLARPATVPVDVLKIDRSVVERLDSDSGLSVIRLDERVSRS